MFHHSGLRRPCQRFAAGVASGHARLGTGLLARPCSDHHLTLPPFLAKSGGGQPWNRACTNKFLFRKPSYPNPTQSMVLLLNPLYIRRNIHLPEENLVDDRVVSFITCVNDEELYRVCMTHINKISLPHGVKTELIGIRQASSMASGYNLGMSHAHGKYKIYLHQDVFIMNSNLITDIYDIFSKFPDLALLGLCGTEVMPNSGIWWEGEKNFGQVIEFRDTYRLLELGSIDDPIKQVQAIDGFFMATQQDIAWNEDIPGFHLYDSAHSLDYKALGLQVAVARQLFPWALHYCGTDWNVDAYRVSLNKFLTLYGYRGGL